MLAEVVEEPHRRRLEGGLVGLDDDREVAEIRRVEPGGEHGVVVERVADRVADLLGAERAQLRGSEADEAPRGEHVADPLGRERAQREVGIVLGEQRVERLEDALVRAVVQIEDRHVGDALRHARPVDEDQPVGLGAGQGADRVKRLDLARHGLAVGGQGGEHDHGHALVVEELDQLVHRRAGAAAQARGHEQQVRVAALHAHEVVDAAGVVPEQPPRLLGALHAAALVPDGVAALLWQVGL